jgi:ClpP class serine protease
VRSNVSASGGYYAATAASAITAGESTITGSIGVASLRPVITKTFFDRLGIAIQSFFTGSTAMSILHEIDDEQKARQEKHIDETYEDFLQKVSADAIERSLTSNDLPLPR